jgi:predicted HNH restriction endonuclease
MDYEGRFIMQKTVDWSLLNDGMTIPVSACALLKAWDESILIHGAGKDIKVLVDGELYDAKLKNQNFEQSNWAGHKDVIQIRYGRQSALAQKLRVVFKKSYDYLFAQKQLLGKSKRQILLPDDIHEYMRLYLTTSSDVLCMECCSSSDYQQLAHTLSVIPEEVYEQSDDEQFFMADKTASIEEKQRLVKYRRIDRSIILTLKRFYDYRDEISGEKIGDEYGDSVVEAHHIDYFTRSQNNDSTNIIIISPNYHRIIHKNNPRFNRKKFQFEFENGEVLRLKLYEHLKVG